MRRPRLSTDPTRILSRSSRLRAVIFHLDLPRFAALQIDRRGDSPESFPDEDGGAHEGTLPVPGTVRELAQRIPFLHAPTAVQLQDGPPLRIVEADCPDRLLADQHGVHVREDFGGMLVDLQGIAIPLDSVFELLGFLPHPVVRFRDQLFSQCVENQVRKDGRVTKSQGAEKSDSEQEASPVGAFLVR
jgi:hypothetical protein